MKVNRLKATAILLLMLLIPIAVSAARASKVDIKDLITEGRKQLGNSDYVGAISSLLKARDLAGNSTDKELLFESEYYLGVGYALISYNGEAMRHYYEAFRLCKENQFGWQQTSYVMNGIANVYFEQNNYSKANEMLTQCYQGAIDNKDIESQKAYASNLAIVCCRQGHYAQAQKYLNEAIALTRRQKKKIPSNLLTVEAELYYKTQNYAKVEQIAPYILNNPHTTPGDRAQLNIYLIQVKRKQGNTDEALQTALAAANVSDLAHKAEILALASSLYRDNGNYLRALDYMDSANIYRDSLSHIQNQQLADNNHLKIEVLEAQSRLNTELANANHRKQIYLLLLLVAVLVIVITLVAIRNMHQRARQEKLIMKEREQALHYKNAMMSQTLKARNNELSTTSMFISARNSLVSDLLEKLQEMNHEQGNQKINELIIHLKELLRNDNEHDQFIINFEKANPGLLDKIKEIHPNLSDSDLKFLAYIRMNMSNRDIASLMNITPDSCKRRKNRISKKLNLSSSAELYNYVSNI